MGRRLHLYLISWNAARIPTVTSPFTDHILDGIPTGCPTPDLLVLALQEVAPISYAFLGGKYLDPYIQAYVIALQNAADAVLGEDYTLIGRNNVGMTVVLVFVKDKNLHKVKSVQYGGIGCGLWEMGNKAGVGVKVEYEVSEGNDNWFANTVELNLVGAHLAPHEWLVDRRNKDWETIVRGLVFEPGRKVQSEEGTQTALLDGETELETAAAETKPVGLYSPNAHTFVMGDLNYRTALSRPSRADRLLFPQPQDRPSDITHFSKLIEGDQCRTERLSGRTLHGFSEANITFPPTYKYKVGKFENHNDNHWDWAKYRWPSWTDRILYLPLDSNRLQTEDTSNTHDGIQIHRYTSIPQIIDSDHKPVTCFLSIPAMPISAASAADALHKKSIRYNPPFILDVGWREKRAAARRREVAVGVVSFFVTTSTGLGIMIGVVGGFLGVWWLLAG